MTLPGKEGSRSLKRLFVDAGLSVREREETPVIYVGGRPAAALFIGVDRPLQKKGGNGNTFSIFTKDKSENGREKRMNTIEKDILKVLISEAELKARVREIGARIAMDYENKDPLFVGVLRGSFMFFADLMRVCPIPCGLDFLAASSYKNATVSSGVVKIDYDIRSNIAGRHIILVEDILDSGNTLYNLAGHLRDRGAGQRCAVRAAG